MSMKKLFESWQKTLEQDGFTLSEPSLLNEATIFDLGLPAEIAEKLNELLKGSSREAKVKVGQVWKRSSYRQSFGNRSQTRELLKDYYDSFPVVIAATAMGHVRSTSSPGDSDWDDKLDVFSDKAALITNNFKDLFKNNPPVTNLIKANKLVGRFFKKGFNGTLPSSTSENNEAKFESIWTQVLELAAWHIESSSRIAPLLTYLNDDPKGKHFRNIKKMDANNDKTLYDIADYAENELRGRENPEQVIHKYDDGYYWYDLQGTSCEIEAGKMGHCGQDFRASTMLSLRSETDDPDVEFGREHWVTVAFNENSKVVFQIKGRENQAPDRAHWGKIVNLLNSIEPSEILETGEFSGDRPGFKSFLGWLKSDESGLNLDLITGSSFDKVRKEIADLTLQFQDRHQGTAGFEIGARVIDGSPVSYYPRAMFSMDTRDLQLNEKGLELLEKDPIDFAIKTCVYLLDSDIYGEYLPDASKINRFYRENKDFELDPEYVGPGSHSGREAAPFLLGMDKKLVIRVPFDATHAVNWADIGSEDDPSNENANSYAQFYKRMSEFNKKSSSIATDIINSIKNAGLAHGGEFMDIIAGLDHKEIYTAGTLPPDIELSTYRNIPTDWELEVHVDEDHNPEIIDAVTPGIQINLGSLIDEHSLQPQDREEIMDILLKRTDGIKRYALEFIKLSYSKATGRKELNEGSIPNIEVDITYPWESRPYTVLVKFTMNIESNSRDDESKVFLDIITKLNTKDDIADMAEEAIVSILNQESQENAGGSLDESVIKMWKRAIS